MSWIPKIVWTFEEITIQSNDHMKKIFELNRQTMAKGWELRHLNSENMWQWLNQIPDFNRTIEKLQFQNDVPQKRSNLIRIALIKHFGGVYMDYTIILTEPLDWLLRISEQEFIENKFGSSPDMLMIHNTQHGPKQSHSDPQTNQQILLFPVFQTFFIAAKLKAKFAQQWFDMYVNGEGMADQSFPMNVISVFRRLPWLMSEKDKEQIKSGKVSLVEFQFGSLAQIVIKRKQLELDQRHRSEDSVQRELAIQYYNLWVLKSGRTAYAIHQYSFNQHQSYHQWNTKTNSLFLQIDIPTLKQTQSFPNRMMRLRPSNIPYFTQYLFSNQKRQCNASYYIHQNSIAYVYLLKNYSTKFYQNAVVKLAVNEQCYKQLLRRTRIIQIILVGIVVIMIFGLVGMVVRERGRKRERYRKHYHLPGSGQEEEDKGEESKD